MSKDNKQEQEETKDNAAQQEKEAQAEVSENGAEDPQKKIDELNDKYLRLYSEFDNYRKRTIKERSEIIKTATEDLMVDLLPVLDDFERAQKNMDEKADFESLKEGVNLMQEKLMHVLKSHGLHPLESSVGEEFNIEKHEAITRIPAPDDKLKGKIVDEVERGYLLKEKVIRFSKVVVGE